jgi:hypothetical protein
MCKTEVASAMFSKYGYHSVKLCVLLRSLPGPPLFFRKRSLLHKLHVISI